MQGSREWVFSEHGVSSFCDVRTEADTVELLAHQAWASDRGTLDTVEALVAAASGRAPAALDRVPAALDRATAASDRALAVEQPDIRAARALAEVR